ncbi:MAG TPA: tRNA glutamyl-Q(34) synthetase GluQRS [Polyangiaceae bacterium]
MIGQGGAAFRGRFAPSPTGDLHLGSAASALVNWLWVRSSGGALVLRVEDTDTPRVRADVEGRQLEDLRWLGLDWDEGPDVGGAVGPYRQSERRALYEAAIADLAWRGLTYYCDCSRADIARVASAPHPGDEGPRYPGTCREFGMAQRDFRRAPAVRLAVPRGEILVDDMLQSLVTEDVNAAVGDFVLQRGDGVFAYQLAVVVDDLAMGITHVIRGADLLSSTARQMLLCELLGESPPRYAHHAMVLASGGERLAKRAAGRSLRDERAAGASPEAVVARVAGALGLVSRATPTCTALEVLDSFDWRVLRGHRTVEL